MSTLSVQLDEAALKAATIQAINGVLSPETKEKLIEQAIVNILKPSNNSWERGTSPLDNIFQSAVLQVAKEEAEKIIKNDENLRARITSLLQVVTEKMLDTNPEKLAYDLADAFVSQIRNR